MPFFFLYLIWAGTTRELVIYLTVPFFIIPRTPTITSSGGSFNVSLHFNFSFQHFLKVLFIAHFGLIKQSFRRAIISSIRLLKKLNVEYNSHFCFGKCCLGHDTFRTRHVFSRKLKFQSGSIFLLVDTATVFKYFEVTSYLKKIYTFY